MTTVITNKIVKVELVKDDKKTLQERGDVLQGKTYKIKSPLLQNSVYITINNNENGLPFEIFVNSKDMSHYQWIVGLTRVMSAIMRQNDLNDVKMLIDELSSVCDPNGGYFIQGGTWMPSIVAHISDVLREHIGESRVIKKKLKCEKCGGSNVESGGGCMTCHDCGESKCG